MNKTWRKITDAQANKYPKRKQQQKITYTINYTKHLNAHYRENLRTRIPTKRPKIGSKNYLL